LLIAAAAAVAGMLALTPLAFANDYDRDRGGNETSSLSYEDDSVQRNQVNLCSSDQDVDVLPSTVVGAILPSVSQEQSGNCVNIADGAGSEPTTEPTTTTPPPPDLTYTITNNGGLPDGLIPAGEQGGLSASCNQGDTRLSVIVNDPAQIATGPVILDNDPDRPGATLNFANTTGSPQSLSITVVCQETNP
jgi:hypothetical protein